jgi:hypothetical protein
MSIVWQLPASALAQANWSSQAGLGLGSRGNLEFPAADPQKQILSQ